MRLIIEGKEYALKFCHRFSGGQGAFGSLSQRPFTECAIFEKGADTETFYGLASTHSKDQFKKSTGRKVSLAKAISGLDRTERTKIWKQYHKITNYNDLKGEKVKHDALLFIKSTNQTSDFLNWAGYDKKAGD